MNDHRALYGAFASNRKISLETPGGRELLKDIIILLAPVNENSTVGFLRAFDAIDLMDPAFHVPLIELLFEVRNALDPEKVPVVLSTIKRLLLGAPAAVKTWELIHGPMQLDSSGGT